MKASLIVTVYEQKKYLPYLIECLKRQEMKEEWELIVCDDGSSADMLQPFKQLSRELGIELRYMWQTDSGFRPGRSRNGGISCARGEVLVFLDGDSLITPDFLRLHAQAHDGAKRICCGSRSYFFTERFNVRIIERWIENPQANDLFAHTHLSSLPFQRVRIAGAAPWSALIGCNFSVLRSQAVNFDEFFIGWGLEDYELGLRLVTRHNYEILPLFENQVCHLEDNHPMQFHPFRPRDHQAIVNYLKNLHHVVRNYPELGHEDLWQTVQGIEFCPVNSCWQLRQGRRASDAELLKTVELVRLWPQLQQSPLIETDLESATLLSTTHLLKKGESPWVRQPSSN